MFVMFSFSIKLRTEKGYFDGEFIMKDGDVSSFVEYVHEKTKHVITLNSLSFVYSNPTAIIDITII